MKFCPSCASPLETAFLDDRDRLLCSARCGFVHWNNPTPVVAAIIEHEGKVLLARNVNWPAKFFALVPGFLEAGETPEEGVLREVEEEIGIKGELISFIGNYAFKEQNQLLICFHIKTEGEVVLNEELADYKLQEKHEVRPWAMGTGPALRDWLISEGVESPWI